MQILTIRDLGRAVRERRRELGLTQAELARRCGFSRQWLVAVEGGKGSAEVGRVLRVLQTLGLRVALEPRPEGTAGGRLLDAVLEEHRGA